MTAMPFQEFREEFLMNRDLPGLQGGQFLPVVIHQNDIVTQVCKTRTGHQPYISRPYYGNSHCNARPLTRVDSTNNRAYFISIQCGSYLTKHEYCTQGAK